MKKKPLTALELALQAQIASVQTARTILEDAIQAAEDRHYADTKAAEGRRHQEGSAAERAYDKTIKPIEAAWEKVFSATLRASFSDTAEATKAERAAVNNQAHFQQALPFIENEIPSNLPGLAEAISTMRQDLHTRVMQAMKELAAAHDQSAKKDRKKLPAARKKKERGIAAAKRKLDKARRAADGRLTKAKAKIDKKLADAKAAAQHQFDLSSEARKQAWVAYLETTRGAEQLLLSALKQ